MTNLLFFGSDRYSAVALSSLFESQRAGVLANIFVVTDQHTDPSPVEKFAITHNLKVFYYPDFDHSLITQDTLGLCASFDHLIPKDVIKLFGGSLFNLHPSLLPQYRNVSPVQYALALGDQVTGITLFRISEGIDNGEIISQISEPIRSDDTTTTLTPRLFQLGAQLFITAIKNDFTPKKNSNYKNSQKLIFTRRLTKDSGYLEWDVLHKLLIGQSVETQDTQNELLRLRLETNQAKSAPLSDLLRALTPWPSIWSKISSKKGELRVTLESVKPVVMLKIAGKPKAIKWSDFQTYYL